MPILLSCQCGKKYQAKDEHAGKRIKCLACGQVIIVPQPTSSDSGGVDLGALDLGTPGMGMPVGFGPGPLGSPPPMTNSSSPPRKSSKSSKKKPQRQVLVISLIAGIGVAVVAISLVVFFVFFRNRQTADAGTSSKKEAAKPTAAPAQSSPTSPAAAPTPQVQAPAGPQSPPAGEIEALEEFTYQKLIQRTTSMKLQKSRKVIEGGGKTSFVESEEYVDPDSADGLVIHGGSSRNFAETTAATAANTGKSVTEQPESNYLSFERRKPRYEGSYGGGRTGVWQLWYDNGTLRARGNYIEDKRNGKFAFWTPTGVKRWEGFYARGDLLSSNTFAENQQSLYGEHAYWLADGPVVAIAFSSDNKLVAAASWDGATRVWEVATKKGVLNVPAFVPREDANPALLRSAARLAFSPDGQVLAISASQGSAFVVQLWDMNLQKVVGQINGPRAPAAGELAPKMVFGSQGKRLVAAGVSGLTLWEVPSGKQINSSISGEAPVVFQVFDDRSWISTDGSVAMTTANSGVYDAWDTESGKKLSTADLRDSSGNLPFLVGSAKLDPGGKLLVFTITTKSGADSGQHYLYYWDIEKNQGSNVALPLPKTPLNSGPSPLEGFALSPNLKVLATHRTESSVSAAEGPLYLVTLWDLAAGKKLVDYKGGERVAFSPDGRVLVARNPFYPEDYSSLDYTKYQSLGVDLHKSLRAWDLTTGQDVLLKGHDSEISSCAFSPDSRFVASGSMDHSLMLWDISKVLAAK